MFDVLVDHPKKRYYLLITILCLFLMGSMIFDIIFGWDIMHASSFSDLLEIIGSHPNSYFGYFFYQIVTSPALYSNDSLYLLSQILLTFIISFNFCDWISIVGMVGLSFSHKHKMSKAMLGIQLGYFTIRMVLILGMVVFLYPTLVSNNATLALTRIYVVSIALFVIHLIFLALLLGFVINIVKLFYLPLFEDANH